MAARPPLYVMATPGAEVIAEYLRPSVVVPKRLTLYEILPGEYVVVFHRWTSRAYRKVTLQQIRERGTITHYRPSEKYSPFDMLVTDE